MKNNPTSSIPDGARHQGNMVVAGVSVAQLERELEETMQNDCDRDPADVSKDALAVIKTLLAPVSDTGIPVSPVHNQHQLETQREATNAAARAGVLRQLDPSTTPSAIPTVPALVPALYRGEVYAGICQDPDLGPLHLILLPGDVRVGSIEDADEFVDSVGGDLPAYAELQHLHEHIGHLFKPGLYYSCDQEEYDGDMATAMFDFAHQVAPDERDEPRQVRARAVRRVLAEADSGSAGGLSAQQVAALAERLIGQHAVADGEESIERARMVSTGIMVGVRLMATGVQKALAALTRQPDGDRQ